MPLELGFILIDSSLIITPQHAGTLAWPLPWVLRGTKPEALRQASVAGTGGCQAVA